VKGFEKLAESIAKMPPNSVLLICVEKCRNPSFNVCAAGCNFNKDMEVCDYCKADQPIDIYETDIAALAIANGYVKAEDYEALKAKVAELTDRLEDATDALDLIESEADLFDATAIASGYIKLEPGQCVVDAKIVGDVVHGHCDDVCCFCDCANCDLKFIKDALAAAIDAAKGGRNVSG